MMHLPGFSPNANHGIPSVNDLATTQITSPYHSSRDIAGNYVSTGSGNSNFDLLVQRIFTIVTIAFNIFCIWKAGYLWTVSFFIGMIFREEAKTRITDYFQ